MSCEERGIADIRALDDGAGDEKSFALVARLSRFWVNAYEFGAHVPTSRRWPRRLSRSDGMVASAPRAPLPAVG